MEQDEKQDSETNNSPTQPAPSSPQQEPNLLDATTSSQNDEKIKAATKIDILLKPAGDAPIMKKKKWTVNRDKKVCWVSNFIKKCIKSEPTDSLFLYVNQSFAPSPDTDIGSIFDCFESDGKLVLHYCRTQAWG